MGLPAEEAAAETPPRAQCDAPAGLEPTVGDDEQDAEMGDADDETMGLIGSLEPSPDDVVSEMLLQQIGSSGRSYRREARSSYKKMVSEMYSPPRVTEELKKMRSRHLLPGFALDLTVIDPADGKPWDFSIPEKRERARKLIRQQRPYMLIGSPECTQFSTWQALNLAKSRRPEDMKRAKIKAIVHVDFMVSLYREQIDGGRYFLHEHPSWATSWELQKMEELMATPGVRRIHGDQCQFGLEIRRGEHQGSPLKKPSGFLSNSEHVLKALSRKCQGQGGECSRPAGGRHQLCSGIHAKDAAKYPRELCRAVLKGVTAQLRADRLLKNGCFGVQVADDEEEIMRQVLSPENGYSGRYKDDLTGQVLKDQLVRNARAKEIAYFQSKGVWIKVDKRHA